MTGGSRMRLEILTIERRVFADDVDIVLAPSINGQLGILPNHTHLMTVLDTGELIARIGDREQAFAISGGFMEVTPSRVTVLADAAEAADEIDVQRAQEARDRAERLVNGHRPDAATAQAREALRRSLTRLRVAKRRALKGHRPGQ